MLKTIAQHALSACRTKAFGSVMRSRVLLNSRLEQSMVAMCLRANSQSQVSAEQELSQFLAQDIKEERKLSKAPANGPGVPGFDVQASGSELILRRSHGNEQITIKLNVNGTVDGNPAEFVDDETNAKAQEEPLAGEMRSLPDFLVEIRKKNATTALVFSCGFLDERVDEAEQPDKADLFEIHNFFVLENNVSIESQEVNERVYLGDGQLIDGQLYDLLMDYLDERGVGVEFGEHLIEYATYYEHGQYVKLLESIHKFIELK